MLGGRGGEGYSDDFIFCLYLMSFMSFSTPISIIIRDKALHKAVPKRKSASPMSWRLPLPILFSIQSFNITTPLHTQLELFFH